jgi:hypothetical protein
MSQYSIILSSIAVAGLMALGSQQARAVPNDPNSMDHSQQNYGVLGPEPHHETGAHHDMGGDHPHKSDVELYGSGMDHSQQNHGVLGVAPPKSGASSPASSEVKIWVAPR